MINYNNLWNFVIKKFPENDIDSWVHGYKHFKDVERFGHLIAKKNGADIVVVSLFAMFHDYMRINDGLDMTHGFRSADFFMKTVYPSLTPYLSGTRESRLFYAISYHDRGLRTNDSTVGTCWDADRIDLTRFDKYVEPRYLSTDAGVLLSKKIMKERNVIISAKNFQIK